MAIKSLLFFNKIVFKRIPVQGWTLEYWFSSGFHTYRIESVVGQYLAVSWVDEYGETNSGSIALRWMSVDSFTQYRSLLGMKTVITMRDSV